jgi:hypothetical protein
VGVRSLGLRVFRFGHSGAGIYDTGKRLIIIDSDLGLGV